MKHEEREREREKERDGEWERERGRESGIKRRFKNGEEGRGGFAFEFIIRISHDGKSDYVQMREEEK